MNNQIQKLAFDKSDWDWRWVVRNVEAKSEARDAFKSGAYKKKNVYYDWNLRTYLLAAS